MPLPTSLTRPRLLAAVGLTAAVVIASSLGIAAAQQDPDSAASSSTTARTSAVPPTPDGATLDSSDTPISGATNRAPDGTPIPTDGALAPPKASARSATTAPSTSTRESAPAATPRSTSRATTPTSTADDSFGPRITVSRTSDLDPDGTKVTVTGKGFDPKKGIYVALCVKPAKGQAPTPCGGGVDTSGTSQASVWVSNNPPPYGANLAVPYGSGGSFRVTIDVAALIGPLDCRTTTCVIATRNDHTRSSDRSQDVLVPVNFARS
jgi:hypothetical protein